MWSLRLGLVVAIVSASLSACGPRVVAVTNATSGTACVGDRCARLTPPGEGWAPLPSDLTETREGASVGWRNASLDAVILAHVTCRGERLQFESAPLDVLARQLLLGTTERQLISDETVPFAGREARHLVVAAKLDGVPRVYDLWVARKSGCLLDVTYVAPPPMREAGLAAFERVVESAASEGTLAARPAQGGQP
jgi:hypothetical protein